MIRFFFDVFFPKRSLRGVHGTYLTNDERSMLEAATPVRFSTDILRQRDIPHLHQVVAAGSYHQNRMLKDAIWRLKYGRETAYVAALTPLLLRALPLLHDMNRHDIALCPVPLHWTRRLHRGFNQSELLACAAGKELGIPVRPCIYRRRPTRSQTRRGKEERKIAMAGKFAVRSNAGLPEEVILVDDLFTSGATLSACAFALRKGGVRRIHALVVAHG